MVRTIRVAHARIPIVLVENIIYQDGVLEQFKRDRYLAKNAALRSVFHELTSQRIKQLYYIPAGNLLGHDGEATVDGTHPNDLGFKRMADAIEPTLRRLLRSSSTAIKSP
jgi:lysophospholipase L1-like esterase